MGGARHKGKQRNGTIVVLRRARGLCIIYFNLLDHMPVTQSRTRRALLKHLQDYTHDSL